MLPSGEGAAGRAPAEDSRPHARSAVCAAAASGLLFSMIRFIRSYLRRRQITARIARRGIESSTRLGRHRWVIERTAARLGGFRRLHRRYERKGAHFAAFASIAAPLICHRRLTK